MKFKIYLFALLASFFAGCGHNHEHIEYDDHEHAVIQLTAYTNDFEVFAEADSFIVGQTAKPHKQLLHQAQAKPCTGQK